MRLVAVIDLMNGVVVRGVGGRRAEFRPLVSPLCASSEPFAVAEALRREYGLNELYLADLDAIAGGTPAWSLYEALDTAGFQLWVDAGVREAEDGRAVAAAGVQVVVGLETVTGPEVIAALAAELGEWLLFSLDLRGGVPLRVWDTTDAGSIAAEAIARGARRVLVLDLARVGEGAGIGTETLCANLATTYPSVEVWAGGGVRGRDDLEQLRSAGVRVALVASALHQRVLTRADVEEITRSTPHGLAAGERGPTVSYRPDPP
jgi:phosphoribosylformimino-5-aminoimidazole carboxamide ribotide isomerase